MREKVLGVNVDVLEKEDVINTIISWIKIDSGKLKHVVTAYSEFFVVAQKDIEFKNIVNKADLVTVDGVSVLGAVEYINRVKGKKNFILKLITGLDIGRKILLGRVGETVTGVMLFEELCKIAGKKRYKVFLLGGWSGVAGRAAKMLLERFPGIRLDYDEGERMVGTDEGKNGEVIKKINRLKPDILFVAYNPIKQEKWIAKYKEDLKAKVAIGVGGTYDEFTGDLPRAPERVSRSGLKWLWRLWLQPRRLGRILRAVVVFPWLVFRESLGK